MRSLILVLSLSLSTSAFAAEMARNLKEQFEAISCASKIIQGYNGTFTSPFSEELPFGISNDGKVIPVEQNRIVSRESKGDVETIVYRQREQTGYDQNGPIYTNTRKTMVIKKENGTLASITRLEDLAAQEVNRQKYLESGSSQRYQLMKSMEVTFKPKGTNGCEVDQKSITYVDEVKSEKGDIRVNYDREFCNSIMPLVEKIGKNNAAECGSLFSAAEMALKKRSGEIAKEGKELKLDYGISKDLGKVSGSPLSMGWAISACVAESSDFPYPATYGGAMVGGFGGIVSTLDNKPAAAKDKKNTSGQR